MALLPLNTCFGKNILTYSLKLLSTPSTIDNGIYVYPTTVSDPNKDYIYNIDLSTNGYNGALPGMSFTFSLVNGKFDNGKTTMKMSYDSLQLYKLHVKWNDITSNILIDTAYTAKIKITQGIIILPSDTSVFQLQKGANQQFVRKIASLKGQIPSLEAGPNRLINDNSQMLASVTDMEYPGINEGNGSKLVKQFEWTLPAGWRTTSNDFGTFITDLDIKQITVIPDYVTAGSIKIRAVNGIGSAYSEYDSVYFDRGFSFTNFPTSITLGDNTSKTFSTTLFNGITYEWSAPSGWQINGQGNTMEALNLNTVNVTPSFCSQIDDRVRVRLKKGGEVSSWYNCKSYQGVLKPNGIVGTSIIYQYEEAPLSINNINMAGVQSISCDESNVVFTGNKDSGFKITFLEAGAFTINVSILMLGCSTSIPLSLSVEVLPHRIQLSGSSYVCPSSSTTFTTENAPPNYTWGCSTNLTPISGSPGSFTTSFAGGGAWVSINAFGKECTRKNFIIGSEITGVDQIVYAQTNRYYAEPACSNQNNIWVLSWQGMNMLTEKPDTVYGKNYVDVVSTTSPNNMTTYDLSLIQDNGYKPIKYISVIGVKLGLIGIKKPNPFPPIELLLYPNPATDNLTVEIKAENTDCNYTLLARTTNVTTEPYIIQLWNEHQGLMRTIEISTSIQQISLQGLPNGMYFVHVVKDGKMLQRKIIWKN